MTIIIILYILLSNPKNESRTVQPSVSQVQAIKHQHGNIANINKSVTYLEMSKQTVGNFISAMQRGQKKHSKLNIHYGKHFIEKQGFQWIQSQDSQALLNKFN